MIHAMPAALMFGMVERQLFIHRSPFKAAQGQYNVFYEPIGGQESVSDDGLRIIAIGHPENALKRILRRTSRRI